MDMNRRHHDEHLLDVAERIIQKREQVKVRKPKEERARRERIRTVAACLQVTLTLAVLAIQLYSLATR